MYMYMYIYTDICIYIYLMSEEFVVGLGMLLLGSPSAENKSEWDM